MVAEIGNAHPCHLDAVAERAAHVRNLACEYGRRTCLHHSPVLQLAEVQLSRELAHRHGEVRRLQERLEGVRERTLLLRAVNVEANVRLKRRGEERQPLHVVEVQMRHESVERKTSLRAGDDGCPRRAAASAGGAPGLTQLAGKPAARGSPDRGAGSRCPDRTRREASRRRRRPSHTQSSPRIGSSAGSEHGQDPRTPWKPTDGIVTRAPTLSELPFPARTTLVACFFRS